MSFNSFADSFSKRLQELSSTVQEKAQEAQLDKKLKDLSLSVSQRTQDFTSNLPTLAQMTQRKVQEKLGQVTDISQLPEEYIELENSVDRIKLIYDNFLKVTQIYEVENYDYPQYISESVNELLKSVLGKIQAITKATTTDEIRNILATTPALKNPNTLNHSLSKVALTSSEYLSRSSSDDMEIADALLKYSDVQAKVADARLQQDNEIQILFNGKLKEELATHFAAAIKARKEVEQKRLQYDIARANFTSAKPEKQASLRVQMEALEDQFAQSTDEAVTRMQEVIDNSEFLKQFQELVSSQLAYHKRSAEVLSEFVSALSTDAVHISADDYK